METPTPFPSSACILLERPGDALRDPHKREEDMVPDTEVLVYCVKCREKTGSSGLEAITMKNGRPATARRCTVCGTRKFRIGAPLV